MATSEHGRASASCSSVRGARQLQNRCGHQVGNGRVTRKNVTEESHSREGQSRGKVVVQWQRMAKARDGRLAMFPPVVAIRSRHVQSERNNKNAVHQIQYTGRTGEGGKEHGGCRRQGSSHRSPQVIAAFST